MDIPGGNVQPTVEYIALIWSFQQKCKRRYNSERVVMVQPVEMVEITLGCLIQKEQITEDGTLDHQH